MLALARLRIHQSPKAVLPVRLPLPFIPVPVARTVIDVYTGMCIYGHTRTHTRELCAGD